MTIVELLKALLLGAIQGISEFLPISSTGHLILAEHIFGISQDTYGLAFDAALHLGTLVAVLWFFRATWSALVKDTISLIRSRRVGSPSERMVRLLLVGTIPAVLLGVLLEDVIDRVFRSPSLVGLMLVLFSLVLIYVEKTSAKKRAVESLDSRESLFIGTAQAIALVPGVSRSGITIAAGMGLGLKRDASARFAFLLSAPIVAGAGGKKLLDTAGLFLQGRLSSFEILFFAVGMMSAAFFGYMTIKYFLKFLSRNTLYPFIIYRLVIGVLIIIFFAVK